MRVPQMEKIFLRMLGMSELKHISYRSILRKNFSLTVACQNACMHVSQLIDGRLVALTSHFFNFEKCFFKSTSEQFCLENL